IVGIFIVLLSRTISVIGPVLLSSEAHPMSMLKVLVWGGLRGGISVALALSLSGDLVYRELIVFITYAIVLFSIIVQGLTIKPLVRTFQETT
ncbi:MAG: cation:proton antiporter, partial [Bacteroidota bacterium]